MSRLAVLLLLAGLWMALGGSFTFLNAGLGLAVAALALRLASASGRLPRLRARALAALLILFLKEFALSTASVVRAVLKPRLDVRPGLVEIPLTLRRDGEIALLACLVTLTPGTLSVELSDDRRRLFVHALDASDPDGIRRSIAEGFERAIARAFP